MDDPPPPPPMFFAPPPPPLFVSSTKNQSKTIKSFTEELASTTRF